MVLAHSLDGDDRRQRGRVPGELLPARTSAPRAPERFRSLLNDSGGDDDGGVIRREVLLKTAMKESYHHADRTFIAELSLYGPFYQEPDWLYFRRDHPDRAERAHPGIRARCANMDPKRANRWLNPAPRLFAEYIGAYIRMVHRAPLTPAERRECHRYLIEWVTRRTRPHHVVTYDSPAAEKQPDIDVRAVVAGRASTH